MFEPDKEECAIVFEQFDPHDEIRREALLALGNGLLSWRASAPEAAATQPGHDWQQEQYAGFYRAGWYDNAPREVNGQRVSMAALVNLPDPFGMSIGIDNSWLSPACTSCCSYQQRLNMRDGVLQRRLEFTLGGYPIAVLETRFLSMAHPRLAVLRWEITPPAEIRSVQVRSVLDTSVTNSLISRNRAYEGARLKNIAVEHDEQGCTSLSAELHDPRRRLAIASEVRSIDSTLRWTPVWDAGRLVLESTCPVPARGSLVLEKRVLVAVDEELPREPGIARQQVLNQLPDEPYFLLMHEHRKSWWALWARMPLRSSDASLQRTLHFHAYHLLQTISPHSRSQDLGFPSRGWQEGYYGQIFWDQILAFPFLCTRFPELARELLLYRYRRLNVARERATRIGLRGAMFPWRSAASGEEETPPFQYNPLSGRWMADDTRLQRHIGAAIAYDTWQLYLATGDKQLLAGFGGVMILEIARFWGSIARFDEERGRYVIRGVIGPDEYHNRYPHADCPGLDNNAYTNLMAVWTLTCAERVLQTLGPDTAGALCMQLDIGNAELDHWRDICTRMYLPFRSDGVLSEFEGFDDLREPPAQWLTDSRPRLDWMLEAQGDSCEHYQLTKQADVLMLLHLLPTAELQSLLSRLGYSMSASDLERTLNYHLAHITHESSLSRAVCAGALASFDGDQSWHYFCETLHVDLDAGTDRGACEGVHLGAMSGSLDTLQRHYLGIRPMPDGLGIFPAIPLQLPDLELGLIYRGARIGIWLDGGKIGVESVSNNNRPVNVIHSGGTDMLGPGQTIILNADRTGPAAARTAF
ncbi:MAG: glycoside hydrolase family 65 protein [Pseudomonas sp.]|nr:glycoside hydrolase family 65 protein [Pseudomonas sp.]